MKLWTTYDTRIRIQVVVCNLSNIVLHVVTYQYQEVDYGINLNLLILQACSPAKLQNCSTASFTPGYCYRSYDAGQTWSEFDERKGEAIFIYDTLSSARYIFTRKTIREISYLFTDCYSVNSHCRHGRPLRLFNGREKKYTLQRYWLIYILHLRLLTERWKRLRCNLDLMKQNKEQ